MKSYNISQKAEQDLEDILFYISQGNKENAYQWLSKIYMAMDRLAEHPKIGHMRPDLTRKDIKFWPIGKYLIAYEIREPIEIIRVISAHRNIRALF